MKRISAGIYNDVRAALKDRLTMVSQMETQKNGTGADPNHKARFFAIASPMLNTAKLRLSLFSMCVLSSSSLRQHMSFC